jgi:transposase
VEPTTNRKDSARSSSIAVNGIRFYFEVYGVGKPLIMLHGGLGGIAELGALPMLLGQQRQVITLELQGHGRTADADRPLRYEGMADDLACFIHEMGFQQADLLGFSLGGSVALCTAIQSPHVVDRLILISTPVARSGIHAHFRDGMTALSAYAAYSQCGHALCGAHLLRELTFLHEQYQQDWAAQMKTLLLTAKASADAARQSGVVAVDDGKIAALTSTYSALVQAGFAANPPPETRPGKRRVADSPARNLLKRLDSDRHAVLRFLHHLAVPFDNNLAERDIRMMKVRQKVSGCFRTLDGAHRFCAIRSYLSTARKRGLSMLSALVEAFAPSPTFPSLLHP